MVITISPGNIHNFPILKRHVNKYHKQVDVPKSRKLLGHNRTFACYSCPRWVSPQCDKCTKVLCMVNIPVIFCPNLYLHSAIAIHKVNTDYSMLPSIHRSE